ncbi:MAG: 4Fe-4S ferredoxin, partial [Halanaerobium sp.]
MTSKVFIADMKASSGSESMVKKLGKLFYKAGFHELIEEDDFVAVKQHFGEPGNTAFIRPVFTRE